MIDPYPIYLIRLWAETVWFFLLRVALVPGWFKIFASRPSDAWLTYDDLLTLNSQHKTVEKFSPEQEQAYQQKWADRVANIAKTFNSKDILEAGCGNGLAALALTGAHREISAVDIVDIRTEQVKQSPVRFSIGDVCKRLPYGDNSFDLIFSINSFEHFEQPGAALQELIRVARPGGLLFLAFSPIYYSPWGLHASRRLGMPYPQLLFSTSTIQQFVDQNKDAIAHTYSETSDRSRIGPFLNKYSLTQYRQIFDSQKPLLKTLAYVETISLDGMDIIFQYPGIIKTKTPSFDNLFVSGIKILARKRE